MSHKRPTERLSRFAYGLLVMAFVMLALFAMERTLRLESQVEVEQRRRVEAQLQRELDLWESTELSALRDAVIALASGAQAFAAHPSAPVEVVYLWSASQSGSAQPQWLSPPQAAVEDRELLLTDPCLVAAARRTLPGTTRAEVERAWMSCADEDLPVALLATGRAADQALADGRPDDAVHDLDTPDLPLFPRADQLATLALGADRLTMRQLQHAAAARRSGNTQRAITILARVGDDIMHQQGQALERTLPFLSFPIGADLRELGARATADQIVTQSASAQRRLAGFLAARRLVVDGSRGARGPELMVVKFPSRQEGATTADSSSDPSSDPSALTVTMLGDPLVEPAYLLAVVALGDGRTAALQLDPGRMLDELLRSGTSSRMVILNAKGQTVSHGRPPSKGVAAQVAFGRLFPQLRLGMIQAEGDTTGSAWHLSQLAPLVLLAILAGAALATRLKADRQLRQLWDRQQAFINRVSHELKTPLAGVKVMADLIALGIVTESDEIEDAAQRIITEVSRMEDRVNEVLRMARRPEITTREPVDLQAMAADLVELWTPRFEQRGASLSATLKPTDPITGDAPIIRDALSNLLDNALKYLDEDRPGLVTVHTRTTGRWVSFEVTDNGIGVPRELRSAIFERFTRVERAGRGKAGGHGLGLAFVAEAVQEHGGKIECRDGIAGGSRFIIRLRRS